jgi:hypothetical protein
MKIRKNFKCSNLGCVYNPIKQTREKNKTTMTSSSLLLFTSRRTLTTTVVQHQQQPLYLRASEIAGLMGKHQYEPKEKSIVRLMHKNNGDILRQAIDRYRSLHPLAPPIPSMHEVEDKMGSTHLYKRVISASTPQEVREVSNVARKIAEVSKKVLHPQDKQGQGLTFNNISQFNDTDFAPRAKIIHQQQEYVKNSIISADHTMNQTITDVMTGIHRDEIQSNSTIQQHQQRLQETTQKKNELQTLVRNQIGAAIQSLPENLPIKQQPVASETSLILTIAQKPEILSQLPSQTVDLVQRAASTVEANNNIEQQVQVDKISLAKLIEDVIPPTSPEKLKIQETRNNFEQAMTRSNQVSQAQNELLQDVRNAALSDSGQRLIRDKALKSVGHKGEQTVVEEQKIEMNNVKLFYLRHNNNTIAGKIDGFKNNELIEIKTRTNRVVGGPFYYEKIQLWIYMEMLQLPRCQLIENFHGRQYPSQVYANQQWITQELLPWLDYFNKEYFDMLKNPTLQDEIVKLAIHQGAQFDISSPTGFVDTKGFGRNK